MKKEKIFKIILIVTVLFVINILGVNIFRYLYVRNLEKDADNFIHSTVKEMLTPDVKEAFNKYASQGFREGVTASEYEFQILPVIERTGYFEQFVLIEGNIQFEKDFNNKTVVSAFYSGKAKFEKIYTYFRFVILLEEDGWKYQSFKIQP